MNGVLKVNITKMKNANSEAQNALHDWIDEEVPQIIEGEAATYDPDLIFDEEQLKQIEKEVTKLLKQYFK